MPPTIEQNQAIARAVRLPLFPLALRDPPDPDPDAEIDEETRNLFRQQGAAPTDREVEDRERKEAEPEVVIPRLAFRSLFRNSTNDTAAVLALADGPAIIERIQLTATMSETAAGGSGNTRISLSYGPEIGGGAGGLTLGEFASLTPLTLPLIEGGQGEIIIEWEANNTAFFDMPVDTPVSDNPFIVAARIDTTHTNLIVRLAFVLSFKEIGAAAIRRQILAFPIGRRSFNPNTRAPRARTPRARVPRGAVITVQAQPSGRILSMRTIAWPSLTPNLKRLWFNQQVGAAPAPGIRWLL